MSVMPCISDSTRTCKGQLTSGLAREDRPTLPNSAVGREVLAYSTDTSSFAEAAQHIIDAADLGFDMDLRVPYQCRENLGGELNMKSGPNVDGVTRKCVEADAIVMVQTPVLGRRPPS
jgi:hypothetical protein